MKRILTPLALASILAVATAGTAFAWPGGDDANEAAESSPAREHGARSHRRGPRGVAMARMAGRLELTNAQKAEIRSIVVTHRTEMRESRAQFVALSPETRRAVLAERRTALRARIAGVLTDAQKAKLAEIRASRTARRAAGHDGEASTRGPRRAPARAAMARGRGASEGGAVANTAAARGAAAMTNGRGRGRGKAVGATRGPRSN